MVEPNGAEVKPRWPVHGWIGLALTIVFWVLNWTLPQEHTATAWGFFPMWLGYCLTVDALVFRRKGSSMFSRSPVGYAMLFLISAPAWWLFELLNAHVQNWSYKGAESFGPFWYAVFASLSFSTVMPTVFGATELVSTLDWVRRLRQGPTFPLALGTTLALFMTGWAMLGLLLAWPQYFFPLLWVSVYFIFDPVNVWLGNRTLLHSLAEGDWRPIVALSLGCLLCGFFWEMWNYYSYPKWVYHVPGVNFLHVFEMPLLGYLGYLSFSWELCALYHLVVGVAGWTAKMGALEVPPECPAFETSLTVQPHPQARG